MKPTVLEMSCRAGVGLVAGLVSIAAGLAAPSLLACSASTVELSSEARRGATAAGSLRLELALPEYFEGVDVSPVPSALFSARRLRIVGSLPEVGRGQRMSVELVGQDGTRRSLPLPGGAAERLSFAIPAEVPPGDYRLRIGSPREVTELPIRIEDRHRLTPGVPTHPVGPGARGILYRSQLGCGSCYLEAAFAGDPLAPDLLTLNWNSNAVRTSVDGGLTWFAGELSGPRFVGDSKSVVTPDGRLVFTGIVSVTHPNDPERFVYAGGLYIGPAAGSSFSGTLFKAPPPNLAPDVSLVADYPKVAYDPMTGNIHVLANSVKFDDGTSGRALFVSRDGGQSFSERKLDLPVARSTDTRPDGSLRAVVTRPLGNDRRQIALARWSPSLESFDEISAPALDRFLPIARVSATSPRYWAFYSGPEMVIDKSPASPNHGRTYLAWSMPASIVRDDPDFELTAFGRDFDVWFSFSDNDGETWATPARVNDDTTGDQGFPSMGVDANGLVHIAFLDKRNNPDAAAFDVYYALIDGGAVSKNLRVNAQPVRNALGGRTIGDYLDMVVAHPNKGYVSYPCASDGDRPTDACLTAVSPDQIPFPHECIRDGDVNGDGELSLEDASCANEIHLSGGSLPSQCDQPAFSCEVAAADVDCDEEVGVDDAIAILRRHFEREEPAECFAANGPPASLDR